MHAARTIRRRRVGKRADLIPAEKIRILQRYASSVFSTRFGAAVVERGGNVKRLAIGHSDLGIDPAIDIGAG